MSGQKTIERLVLNYSGPGGHIRTGRYNLFGPCKTIERLVLNLARKGGGEVWGAQRTVEAVAVFIQYVFVDLACIVEERNQPCVRA